MELEQRTMSKVIWRIVPFVMVSYFVAYIDRINLSFAALQMNGDLGFSSTVFGFGAGVFFLAYFLFEVPSNILLEKVGARKWIARIMISWGLVSAATIFIRGETSFYLIRALLGIAEAGFFPGIIFFLTLWFPAAYRGRIIALFMVSVPISAALGAPISGLLLKMDGLLGLRGWHWLFLLEALPAILLGIATLFYLTDSPQKADWLESDERDWLKSRLEDERQRTEAVHRFSLGEALTNGRVLAFALVYFGAVAMNTGVGFFMPQIIKGFGIHSNLQVTLITAVPFLVAALGSVLWSRHSDKVVERKWHTAIPLMVAAASFLLLSVVSSPWLTMLLLTAAVFGFFSMMPPFWALSSSFLTGAAAAGGIAAINSIGNLAGFGSPFAIGWIKDATGSFSGGMLMLGIVGVIAIAILFVVANRHAAVSATTDYSSPASPAE